MRIDAHQHFWRYSPATHGWIGDSMSALRRDFMPADLEPILKAQRFDACIAVQAAQTVSETRWLLELGARHPFIAGVVGWVDLCAINVERALAELARDPRLV